jgi:hypothetical protein
MVHDWHEAALVDAGLRDNAAWPSLDHDDADADADADGDGAVTGVVGALAEAACDRVQHRGPLSGNQRDG